MSEPKLYQDPITGKIQIKENSQYNQIDAEHVIVHSNVTTRLYGNVKDITLNEGARVYIHGIIKGNIENKGGEIHYYLLGQK